MLNEYKQKSKIKKPLSFPWWFKIVTYISSFFLIMLSIIFIILKGINLGELNVKIWFTSLFILLLVSILLVQPLQVLFISMFLLFFYRSKDENIQEDYEDYGQPINYIQPRKNLLPVGLNI